MERAAWMSDAGYRSGVAAEQADNDPRRIQAVQDAKSDGLIAAAGVFTLVLLAVALLFGIAAGCIDVGDSASSACVAGTVNRGVFRALQVGLGLALVGLAAVIVGASRRP